MNSFWKRFWWWDWQYDSIPIMKSTIYSKMSLKGAIKSRKISRNLPCWDLSVHFACLTLMYMQDFKGLTIAVAHHSWLSLPSPQISSLWSSPCKYLLLLVRGITSQQLLVLCQVNPSYILKRNSPLPPAHLLLMIYVNSMNVGASTNAIIYLGARDLSLRQCEHIVFLDALCMQDRLSLMHQGILEG